VIRKALNLYQTAFRKPSFTVYGLDFSGSMEGSGETLLKEAMQLLLSPSRAGRYWLQMAPGDSAVIFAFSDSVFARWTVSGADTHQAAAAAGDIRGLKPSGRTDLYAPVIRALECLNRADTRRYIPAVILLSDGESNTGFGLEDVRSAGRRLGGDVPVFGILFGEASREEMESLADWSNGRVFDGRTDLVGAFRSAKGYN
jgi:Ca-activated chloride channel family protein